MKKQFSAGGVVVRKKGKVWQVLILKDMNNAWTFPKGLVEKGETAKAAAVREIREEVGLTAVVSIGLLPAIDYMYRRNGFIQKTVQYFIFRSTKSEQLTCQRGEGIQEARWVSIARAFRLIGYPDTNRMLLLKTRQLLTRYGPQTRTRRNPAR